MPVDSIDGQQLPPDYSKKKAPVRKRAQTGEDPSTQISPSPGKPGYTGKDILDLSPAALQMMREQQQNNNED